jgi:hypothetical protein
MDILSLNPDQNAVKIFDARPEKRTKSGKLRGRFVKYICTEGTVCQNVN